MTERINYGRLMHKAMQGLVADVLGRVAEGGLPGEHHFYITFDTTHPGVDMADWLIERHPEEMTIVIQEWFTDLAVMQDRFAITLNFSDSPEPLVIPFDAIKTFVDPSVEFGLRFDAHTGPEDDPDGTLAEDDGLIEQDGDGDAETAGADVVSLDSFRKH